MCETEFVSLKFEHISFKKLAANIDTPSEKIKRRDFNLNLHLLTENQHFLLRKPEQLLT